MYTGSGNLYFHYPDPNDTSVIEYYTNKLSRNNTIRIHVLMNKGLSQNLTQVNNFILDNCIIASYALRKSNRNDHFFDITPIVDRLNDSGTTFVKFEIPPGTLYDPEGNTNEKSRKFEFLIDTIPPTFEISSDISSGSYSKSSYITLQLRPNKKIRTMSLNYLTVTNGSISDLTSRGDYWEAYLEPNPSELQSDSQITVQLMENTIQDLGGNFNDTVSNLFIWNYDGSRPSVSLTSDDITNGQYYNLDYITIKVSFSEDVVEFTESNLTLSKGELKRFTKVDDANYTFRFYPLDPINSDQLEVKLNENVVVDLRGNGNSASVPFIWNYDFSKPVLTISSPYSSGASSEDNFIQYTIFSSKDLQDITLDSFEVENATIVDLLGSGKNYTVKLYPLSNQRTSIEIPRFGVRDTTNNQNDLKSNSFDKNPYYWTYSGQKPIISLNSNDLDLQGKSKNESINVIMKINDTDLSLNESDLDTTRGTISNYTFDTTNQYYTFTLTATVPHQTISVQMPENVVQYSQTIFNSASNKLEWVWNKDPATMVISSTDISSGDLTNHSKITIIFTPSEQIQQFVINDVSKTNAKNLINFGAISGTNNYSCTLQPLHTSRKATITLKVAKNKFKSMYGINNADESNTFVWNYDPIIPTVSIRSDFTEIGEINNKYSAEIIIETSKVVKDITTDMITARNGYITDLTKVNDQYYTAKLNAAQQVASIQNVECYIDINKIEDNAGNKNNKVSNYFNWISDTVPIEVIETYVK